jgi:hypothetical protein
MAPFPMRRRKGIKIKGGSMRRKDYEEEKEDYDIEEEKEEWGERKQQKRKYEEEDYDIEQEKKERRQRKQKDEKERILYRGAEGRVEGREATR